jgi:hypothetical protein
MASELLRQTTHCLFTVKLRPAHDFSLTRKRHPCRWKAAKLGHARGSVRAFEQGQVFIVPHLLRHRASVFSGLIRRTAPFSRLLRYTKGSGRSILIRIFTGWQRVHARDHFLVFRMHFPPFLPLAFLVLFFHYIFPFFSCGSAFMCVQGLLFVQLWREHGNKGKKPNACWKPWQGQGNSQEFSSILLLPNDGSY